MLVKVSELQGKPLDYAVIIANGWLQDYIKYGFRLGDCDSIYSPSTDWSQGGPIIDRERLCNGFQHQLDTTYVPEINHDVICWARTTAGGYLKYGPTPLIAAMRCYVASKLGDTIDVPEELLK